MWFASLRRSAFLLFLPLSLHAKTVTLTAADNHVPLTLIVGDTVLLDLPSIPPGNMHLVTALPLGSGLSALDDSFTPSSDVHLLGIQHFRFNAARAGDSQLLIRFEAVQPGSAQPPSDTFSAAVHIASGEPPLDSTHPALLGIYQGDLPCADCSAVRTRLTLYTKAPHDFTEAFFIRTATYVAAPHGTTIFADRGTWTVLRGDATNPDAIVYQLNPDSRSTEYFLRGQDGTTLTQLDPDLKAINTKANLTLTSVHSK